MKLTTIYNDPYNRATKIEPWVYWDKGFSDEELQKIIDYCETKEIKIATTVGTQDPELVKKIRTSKASFHPRNDETAWIFDKTNMVIQSLNEMFYGFELNGYPEFQYTIYEHTEKGRYDWHMDTIVSKNEYNHRKLSLTLLLNDDFEGGEFQINTGQEKTAITVPVNKGRAIVFPSYMIHRVKPVTKGVRKSLVIWVVGPKFR